MTDTARLTPGDLAPAFTLPDSTGALHSLEGLAGRRAVVWFYPAAMTPGCTKEACGFRDALDILAGAGYAVVGISPDKPAKIAAFAEQEQLVYPLLSDPDHEVMTSYGAWGPKKLYGKEVVGVIRSTFVLDGAGRVERAYYGIKATGHVERLLRDLDLGGTP